MTAFDALFVPEELREAVSGRSWLDAMLEVERALAHVVCGVPAANQAFAIAQQVLEGEASGDEPEGDG